MPHKCNLCEWATKSKDVRDLHHHIWKEHGVGLNPLDKKCEICGYQTYRNYDFTRHCSRHSGGKVYHCDKCSYSTHRKDTLRNHICKNSEERPYKCDECSNAYRYSDSLRRHKYYHHTKEGQRQLKKKQNSVRELLESRRTQFVEEHCLNFSCFSTDGRRAFVDFIIPKSWGSIFLEVDEDQHCWYDPTCETRRMMDIYTSVCEQCQSVCFVRYNPDNYFDASGVKYNMQERREILMAVIEHHHPRTAFEVMYLFYNLNSENKPLASCGSVLPTSDMTHIQYGTLLQNLTSGQGVLH